MKFIRFLFLPVFCLAAEYAAGQTDSLSIFRRVMRDASPAGALPGQLLKNPAVQWFRQDFQLSELFVGYDDDRRSEASLSQDGDRYNGFGFAARSFVPTGKNGRAFGSAGYSNGTRHDVQWSETSDFALLYPYLTADSVGGSLKTETYRFAGGYAHTVGAWTWAAQLSYRALLEYREVDPRPRNVVSDLQGSLAAARSVGPDYRLSLAVRGRKYSQGGDIDFYNEMNSSAIYHLTGLGMDYVRFAGLNASAYYDGWGAGGSVDFFPFSRKGFSASVGYDYFTFRKQMRDLNNLPLVSLGEHALTALLAYRTEGTELAWGMTVEGEYKQRKGAEHIFGDPSGNAYPEIGRSPEYSARVATATLSGFVGSSATARTVWWVRPSAMFLGFSSEYASVLRKMEFSRWQAGVDGAVLRAWGRWMLGVQGGVAHSGNVSGELSLPGANFNSSRICSLQDNFRYLTDGFTRLQLAVQANVRIGNDRTVFVRGGWTRDWFGESGTADGITASVGFGF